MIYGKIGESAQQIGGDHPGAGWVDMAEERPGADYVAQEDGTWLCQPELRLLSAAEFSARFTEPERDFICEHMAKLALTVLSAPNGIDVTDAKAQEARAALEAVEDEEGNRLFPDARLDAIFAAPE